jgi:hypothetical protein
MCVCLDSPGKDRTRIGQAAADALADPSRNREHLDIGCPRASADAHGQQQANNLGLQPMQFGQQPRKFRPRTSLQKLRSAPFGAYTTGRNDFMHAGADTFARFARHLERTQYGRGAALSEEDTTFGPHKCTMLSLERA